MPIEKNEKWPVLPPRISDEMHGDELAAPPLSKGMRVLLNELGIQSEDDIIVDAFREVNLTDPPSLHHDENILEESNGTTIPNQPKRDTEI